MPVFQIPFFQEQPVGDQTFTTIGSTVFTVPDDVRHINIVCVGAGGGGAGQAGSALPGGGGGGGALSYANCVPVTPGEALTVFVGAGGTGGQTRTPNAGGDSYVRRGVTDLCLAKGGSGANGVTPGNGGAAASGVGDVRNSGGIGGTATDPNSSGGGGAAGYAGIGGTGGSPAGISTGRPGTGGGGGGGAADTDGSGGGGGGGGVGLFGQGSDGTGSTASTAGGGGNGGSAGSSGGGQVGDDGGDGGNYGGGGGGSNDDANSNGGTGAQGAVRIVWGPDRLYPSTNVDKTITFLTSAVSSASTITIPSTAQEGDVAFLFDNGYNATSSAPTLVTPTGWTLASAATGFVNDAGNVSVAGRCSYKILTSSDPETTITGINGGAGNRKIMLVFRPNFTVTTLTLSLASSTVATTDPAAQTISMTASTAPSVGLAHMGTYTGAVTTRTVTGGAMTEVSNTTNQYVQYVIDNTVNTIADSTVDIADGGTNTLQSFYANFNGFPYG